MEEESAVYTFAKICFVETLNKGISVRRLLVNLKGKEKTSSQHCLHTSSLDPLKYSSGNQSPHTHLYKRLEYHP